MFFFQETPDSGSFIFFFAIIDGWIQYQNFQLKFYVAFPTSSLFYL